MFAYKKTVLAALSAAAILVAAPAFAGTTVSVSLWDQGSDAAMPTDLGYGMGGDMSKATMGIDISPKTVEAGHVTFNVTNASKDTIHEMILAPLTSSSEKLPYIANENRVDEEKAGHLGEVSELDPGASGELGVTLKPGTYLVYCNIPGHFVAGMWATLKVTK
jgi:uncharacterized cupredoxin-like copper-binding protein